MEPIALSGNPILLQDDSGKPRWYVILKNGVKTTKARWMMMNFLHAVNMPKKLHVHHKNTISNDDRIENFELLTASEHAKLHHHRDYKYGVSCTEEPEIYNRLHALDFYYKHKDDPCYQEKRKLVGSQAGSVYFPIPLISRQPTNFII